MKIGVIGRGIILEKFRSNSFDVIDLDMIDTAVGSCELVDTIESFRDKSHIILCPAFTNYNESTLLDHSSITYQNYVLPSMILDMLKRFKARIVGVSSTDLYNSRQSPAIITSELHGTNIYYATKMVCDFLMQDRCDLVVRHAELMDGSSSVENIIYRVSTSKYTISDYTNVTTVDDLVCSIISCIKKKLNGVVNIASPERVNEYSISEVLGYETIPMSLLEWRDEFKHNRQMSLVDCSKMGYIHDMRVISFELLFEYITTICEG